MRPLRKFALALGRWWLRQSAALLVVLLGAVGGWWLRKAIGPSLVSESFSRVRAAPTVPARPGPLTPRDPVVVGYAAEFASLDRPSGTLLRLQADLERGRVTDFEALAKSLLSHPLERFRNEAMQALLTAWGRKDPGGALAFIDWYNLPDYPTIMSGKGHTALRRSLTLTWAADDPASAIEYLSSARSSKRIDGEIVQAVLSQGSVLDRLQLLTDKLGEFRLARFLSGGLWGNVSSAEWQSLASRTNDPNLASRYATEALRRKWIEKPRASANEAQAWVTEVVPNRLRSRIDWRVLPREHFAALLPSLSPADLQSDTGTQALAWLRWDNPEAVSDFLGQHGASWIQPKDFVSLGAVARSRPDSEWTDLLKFATDPARREALGRGLVHNAVQSRIDSASLPQLLERLSTLGPDSEPAMGVLLSGLSRSPSLVPQLAGLFASQTVEFQTERRMELVVQLAPQSTPAAAELWLGASPEELAQPGAAVVSEELVARYLKRDSEAASYWVGRLPPGIARDRAVARMIELTASRDPETCAQWASTIQNPVVQERATRVLRSVSEPLPSASNQ